MHLTAATDLEGDDGKDDFNEVERGLQEYSEEYEAATDLEGGDGKDDFDEVERGLQEYSKEYEECLAQLRSDAVASGDPLMPQRVSDLVTFESAKKLLDSGRRVDAGHKYLKAPAIMAAIEATAANSAQDLVSAQMIAAMRGDVHDVVSTSAAEHFAAVIQNYAVACGRSQEEADALGVSEKAILTSASDHSIGEIARDMAVKLPLDLWEECKAEAMDVDFFVEHDDIYSGEEHCSQHVRKELVQHSAKIKQQLNYHMKHALIVHNSSNGIGHRVLQHMRTHGVDKNWWGPDAPDCALHADFLSAAASPLSAMQQRQVQYLEDEHMSSVIGVDRQSFCANPPHLGELQSYWKCLCEQAKPELACRTQNMAGLTQAAETFQSAIQRYGARKRQEVASEANTSRANFGPCKDPLSCEITMGDESFTIPPEELGGCRRRSCRRRRNSRRRRRSSSTDLFEQIQEHIENIDSACKMSAECSFQFGTPAQICKASLKITSSIESSGCNQWHYTWFTGFKIGLKTEFCLGSSDYADILEALGENCFDLGGLEYWPFTGKLAIRVNLPIPIPLVSAWIKFNFPVVDELPHAVVDWCDDWAYGKEHSVNFRDCKEYLNRHRGGFEMWLEAEVNYLVDKHSWRERLD